MKIFNIPFLQNNNIVIAPKNNSLSPLSFDTVTFSVRPIKDIPYSIFQKERELDAIRPILKEAIVNAELLSAEDISDKTGLDIYVIKLRLSTNSEIRQLYNEMKLANSARVEYKNQTKIQKIQSFLNDLSASGQKLTDNEMAFYLGLEKAELLELIKLNPSLEDLYNVVLLEIKATTLERKTQSSKTSEALRYIYKEDSYDAVAQRARLSPKVVRVRVNENDELFKKTIDKGLYPPDIYSDSAIEKQEDRLMDVLLDALRHQKQISIAQLAENAELSQAIVMIRIKNNEALQGTYNRMMGIDEDED